VCVCEKVHGTCLNAYYYLLSITFSFPFFHSLEKAMKKNSVLIRKYNFILFNRYPYSNIFINRVHQLTETFKGSSKREWNKKWKSFSIRCVVDLSSIGNPTPATNLMTFPEFFFFFLFVLFHKIFHSIFSSFFYIIFFFGWTKQAR
jgi:hypothetical protein